MRRVSAVLGQLILVLLMAVSPALAADASTSLGASGTVRGSVLDPLGAPVPGAKVTLLRDGQVVKEVTSDSRGAFLFDRVDGERYQLEVTFAGFETTRTAPTFFGSGDTTIDLRLQLGALEQSVLVTAAAGTVTQAETGASTTVVDQALIESLGNTDLLEPLRTVPGAAIVQTGARGGGASLFLRGGASNFTKVLIDGVAANDIGGAFDFGDLATTGIEQVEVLRGSNSVLYGSDALTGVVNISTRRGRTRIPELMASVDGGNFSTAHGDAGIGGAIGRFDYYGVYSHLRTDNDVPNNAYRNNTFATRVGARLGANTDLSGTVRWIDADLGSPNAILFYGIADDSSVTKQIGYTSVTARSQWTSRWQSHIRFGVTDQEYNSLNPSPTGARSDSSAFANYLGNTVTITNPAGQSVTGRAILDFCCTFPSAFTSTVNRRSLYGDTSVHVSSSLDIAGGARVESEKGTSDFNGSISKASRNNYGAFAEARVAAFSRVFVAAGIGVDRNEVFGTETSPRVSVAAYLRQPMPNDPLGDTKVTLNAGKGLKEPSVSQELSSLFVLIPPATASSLGITSVGPERSRTFDIGIEQGFARNRARARVAYFNNEFSDLIEFLSKSSLALVGVPSAAANATAFGAYVNAQSNDAKGIELSGDAVFGRIRMTGSYTYLDAVVTESFSSGALFPSTNPAFPGVRIGQFSPLVGNKPFRRPANSGSVTVGYTDQRLQFAVAGYFYGKSDDSTFLSDAFFGTSLLLPNQDLNPAYQKFDISASYKFHPRLRWYLSMENAFDEDYQASAGFPALPRAVRTGLSVRVGGD
jgi:vitamin B12 transporter